ncbi:hypothetical protein HPB47_017491, partial [Ixodes persulcatus]
NGSKLYGAISGPRRAQLDCARNTFTSTVTRPRVFSSWSSALAAATGSSSPMPRLRCLSTRSPDDPPSKEEPLQKGKDQRLVFMSRSRARSRSALAVARI